MARLLEHCPPEAFAWRAGPSRRSITEIIAQLADAELLASVRIRRIITQDRPYLYGHKPEEWAQRLGYQRQSLEDVALLFTLLRRVNGALLAQLASEDWRRTGYHDEGGETSLFQLIEGNMAQTAQHLEQARAVVAEFAAQTNGRAGLLPAVATEGLDLPAGGAKFYALALLAGLTILTVGFFMQSRPIYLFGGIVSGLGVLLVLLALLRRNK